MGPLGIILAGLGGYVAFEGLDDKEPAKAPSVPVQQQTTSKFAPITGKVPQRVAATSNSVKLKALATHVGAGVPKPTGLVNIVRNGSVMNTSRQTIGAQQQALDQAKRKLKQEYDALSAKAKEAGAAKLNDLIKPSPGLTGKESWEDASKKIGAAAGSQGASAACSAYPATAPAAPVCAMAGAYLGKKLGPIIAKELKSIGKKAEQAVKKAYNKVEDAVENAVDDVVSSVKFW